MQQLKKQPTSYLYIISLATLITLLHFSLGLYKEYGKVFTEGKKIFVRDQMQNLAPFFRNYDSSLFPNYFFFDAAEEVSTPLGYRMFYYFTNLFAPPWEVSIYLMPLLSGITFFLCLLCLQKFSSKISLFVAGVFLISSICITTTQLGLVQRAFAYPAVGLSILGAINGNLFLLATAFALSILFYPPIAPFTGICAAIFCIFNSSLLNEKLSPKHQAIYLVILAFIALLIVPLVIAKINFGGGWYSARLAAEIYQPIINFFNYFLFFGSSHPHSPKVNQEYFISIFQNDFFGHSVLIVALIILLINFKKDIVAKRLLIVFIAIAITYCIVFYCRPHLYTPNRITRYSLVVFDFILIFYAISKTYRWQTPLLIILLGLALFRFAETPYFKPHFIDLESTFITELKKINPKSTIVIPYEQTKLSSEIILIGKRKVYVSKSLHSLIGGVAHKLRPEINRRFVLQQNFFRRHFPSSKNALCKKGIKFALFDKNLLFKKQGSKLPRRSYFKKSFDNLISNHPQKILKYNDSTYTLVEICKTETPHKKVGSS